MKPRAPLAERLKKGLREAIAHEKDELTLQTRKIFIPDPPRSYGAEDIAALRHKLGYTQVTLAAWLAVSPQAVRSWEQGTRKPSGSASRVMQMLESPEQLSQILGLLTQ